MTRPAESWPTVLTPPALSPGTVHVLSLPLDVAPEALAALAGLLSEDETGRARRFRFERDGRRFVACRGFLRSVLGLYLDEDPRRIEFRNAPGGKPSLASPAAAGGLRFNLSHSHEMGLVALARGLELGVDVECVRPLADALAIAERFFSAGERASLRSLPEEDREAAFFACWVRKEAFLKATGEGLARPLDDFDVSVRPEHPVRVERVAGDPEEAGRWSLRELHPAPGYFAALAARGVVEEIFCGRFARGRETNGYAAVRSMDVLEAR